MGRLVAVIFAVLTALGAIFCFLLEEPIAGLGGIITVGFLVILIDVMKSLELQASTQKALARTLAPQEFAKEIKRNPDLYTKGEMTWAVKTREETKTETVQDEAKNEPPIQKTSNAPALGAPTRTS
jgi:hypothetical protein